MQSTCEGHPASFACNDVHKIINISSQTNTVAERVKHFHRFTAEKQSSTALGDQYS